MSRNNPDPQSEHLDHKKSRLEISNRILETAGHEGRALAAHVGGIRKIREIIQSEKIVLDSSYKGFSIIEAPREPSAYGESETTLYPRVHLAYYS